MGIERDTDRQINSEREQTAERESARGKRRLVMFSNEAHHITFRVSKKNQSD